MLKLVRHPACAMLWLTLLLLISAVTHAECPPPTIPAIPDGGSASMEQMLAAKQTFELFQQDLAAYRQCIDRYITDLNIALAAGVTAQEAAQAAETKTYLATAYNQSVSIEEHLATQFNTAIKAYRQAHP